MHRLLLVLASLACLSTAACSSSSNPAEAKEGGAAEGGIDAGAEACSPYESDADLTTPTVSFKTDILPVFTPGCGIAGSTCHGAPDVVQQQRPYLAAEDGGTDAAVVVSGLVGVLSNEDPQMNLVTASDPTNSYLMHKIDGDMCTLAAACAKGQTQYTDCGQQMPYSSPPLDPSTRDTIRRWIAQGAKNN
jgi:hypothetical protein